MAEKKSKALEHDLIDELLGDDHTRMQPPAKQNDDKTELSDPEQDSPRHVRATHPLSRDGDTERVDASEVLGTSSGEEDEQSTRAAVGRFGAFRSSGPASSTEAALAQSENLRVAQTRLLELEQEIERLRLQNEELAASGDQMLRKADQYLTENQRREVDYQNALAMFEQEKGILIESKKALQRDLEVSRRKTEELELRLSTNISKIRVRERELENRLELVKMEGAALIRTKDEMILELKRNNDQTNLELTNYRNKNQELNRQMMDKQEMLRRTVKALRLALSMLEGEEDPLGAAKPGAPVRKIK